jgi:hypothetical protein
MRRLAAEFSWVMCGKFAMIGANAVLVLLLAERLDLVTCGHFVTMIAGQLLLSRVLMPGIESGVTRLLTLASYQARQDELMRGGLRVIWWLSAAAALIGVAICGAWVLLDEPNWKLWLTAAIVAGGAATALVDYCYAIHLAHLRYREAAAAQGGTALLRLFVIAPVPILWPQQAWLVFLLYPLVTLLSGLLLMKLLQLERSGMNDLGLIADLLRYSSWQGVTNVAAVLSLYQGTFVLNLYGSYPDRFEVRYVSGNGGIRWKRGCVNVSTVCIGEYVGLDEIDDGVWNVYFGPLKLGRLLDRHMKIEDAYGRLLRHSA